MYAPQFETQTAQGIVFGGRPAPQQQSEIRERQKWKTGIASMFSPYLNLEPSEKGPLHTKGVELALQVAQNPEIPAHWTQRLLPPSFRWLLVRRPELSAYKANRAEALPPERRSAAWSALVEHIEGWDDLDNVFQLRWGKLLLKLGFYEQLLSLIPKVSITNVKGDPIRAHLAYVRASARATQILGHGPGEDSSGQSSRAYYRPDDLILIARYAPRGSHARFAASLRLMVLLGKAGRDPATVEQWVIEAQDAAEDLRKKISSGRATLLKSALFRAKAFLPWQRGNKEQTRQFMERAEELARSAPRQTNRQCLLADDNLNPVLETHSRVLEADGQRAKASALLEEALEVDPYDARIYLALGNLRTRQGRLESAAAAYNRASSLGPPVGPVANFQYGVCCERQGNLRDAVRAHLKALELDPYGISPVLRLLPLTRTLGWKELETTCSDHLRQLKTSGWKVSERDHAVRAATELDGKRAITDGAQNTASPFKASDTEVTAKLSKNEINIRRSPLPLTPRLYNYLLNVSLREPPELKHLRRKTAALPEAALGLKPEVGQLLNFLVQMVDAHRAIDIGTFTGYSALRLALSLPKAGYVLTCECEPAYIERARQAWKRAGVEHRIEVREGNAVEILGQLTAENAQEPFDIAFIDADKSNYDKYYEQCLELVATGGLVVLDNTLWQGRVADPSVSTPSALTLRELNERIGTDERVEMIQLPLGDGVTMARKRT